MRALARRAGLFASPEHFRLGTDSVLLADFVNMSSLRRGIDLGCGSGAIALLLLCRDARLKMTGLEHPAGGSGWPQGKTWRATAFRQGRVVISSGDIRRCRELFKSGEFDFAAANPPYFAAGSGPSSPSGARAGAREEASCTLSELCRAAAYLVRTGGGFFVVYRPERLSELFCAMTAAG
jgi:tRNA1(Val) A37 N6-methylase TrmN6